MPVKNGTNTIVNLRNWVSNIGVTAFLLWFFSTAPILFFIVVYLPTDGCLMQDKVFQWLLLAHFLGCFTYWLCRYVNHKLTGLIGRTF